jgi:hypothetical protein
MLLSVVVWVERVGWVGGLYKQRFFGSQNKCATVLFTPEAKK